MNEILESNYKMNKFPIGSVIESCNIYKMDKIVVDFETAADGVGIYTVELACGLEGGETRINTRICRKRVPLKRRRRK